MLAVVSLADAAAAATALGVVLAAWALFLQRGQSRTQFEDAVVAQYRQLIKPDIVLDALLKDVVNNMAERERTRFHHIYLYLDLCNEQVFLRAIGRVSRSTWRIQWSDGIKENLEDNQVIAETWGVIQTTTHDFHELRALQESHWKDPRGWEPLWRRPLVRLGLVVLRVPNLKAQRKDAQIPEGQ